MNQKAPLNKPSFNYNLQPQNTPTNSIREAGSANIFLPLRLFLAISFLAAGFDKLFDPQFFDPNAAGYIGNQLAGFASQSPLGGFLTDIAVPQATLFGAIVLIGELAIGLGILLGLYSRIAAFFGFLLSITLWLTASWEVTPFFLGSDLPYAMGWLTLFLAGAHPVLSLDAYLKNRMSSFETAAPQPANIQTRFQQNRAGPRQAPPPDSLLEGEKLRLARRQFLTVAGGTILAGALTGAAWVHSLHNDWQGQSTGATQLTLPPTASTGGVTTPATNNQPTHSGTAGSSSGNQPTQAAGTLTPGPANSAPPPAGNTNPSAPTQTPAPQPAIKGTVIGKLAAIPVGNVLAFNTPNDGESAYLVHEKDGSVKAFSRICTHEGCEVSFNQSNQIFVCPCHGAQFDATTGAVLRRPARQPLKSFAVQVDGSGNVIYTG